LNANGSYNVAVGAGAGNALATGDDNIDIGHPGVAGDSHTIRIGLLQTKTYIAGLGDYIGADHGVPVYVDPEGRLGTGDACPPECPSSERFKDNIKPMDKVSEAILALKPVTFRYKKEFKKFDPKEMPQFGLIAEEVEKVNRDLITRDRDGKPYAVRYEAVNAMLLNEFLKAHKIVQEQAATITLQRKDFEAAIAQQQKQIETLAAGLQKVSAQLELNKSKPQTALNNQ